MSEISKGALTSENNNSFPNNNTGYITPTILRTFNQNMIDSLVDEISYTADSASVNTKITNLQSWSSSLDATYATDAELSASVAALSSSIAVTDLAQSASIAGLQQFSSSLDATFATDAQLAAVSASLSADKVSNSQTSSMSVASASFAVTASYVAGASINTGSFATTGSNTFRGTQIVSGSVNVTNDINVGPAPYAAVNVTADVVTDPTNVFSAVGVNTPNGANLSMAINSYSPQYGSTPTPTIIGYYNNSAGSDTAIGFPSNGEADHWKKSNFKYGVDVTGSLKTSGSVSTTGSVNISGSFRAIVPQPASIGTTTNIFATTASIGTQISQNITRLGGGATDVNSWNLQVLSGSSSTGDTLSSQLNIGVANNTSTFMTGSTVNAGITATWATGSGGGRVVYNANMSVTAQSGSAAASITANTIKLGSSAANIIHTTGSVQLFNTLQVRGNTAFTSSVDVSGSTLSLNNSGGVALKVFSGSVEITSPQGTGYFYSNLPMTSSNLRINGPGIIADLFVSGVFSGNSTLNVAGNSYFTGSVNVNNNVSITGSLDVNGNNIVNSINSLVNATGSYAKTNTTNTFSQTQTFNNGIISNNNINLYNQYGGFNIQANAAGSGSQYPGANIIVAPNVYPGDVFGGFSVLTEQGAALGQTFIGMAASTYSPQYFGTNVPCIIANGNNPGGNDTAIIWKSNGRAEHWKASDFKYGVEVTGSVTIQSGSGDLYVHGHKQFNGGMFQNNTTLSGSAGVSQSIALPVTDVSYGVTIGNSSRITMTNAGTYNIQFSAQIETSAGADNVYIWFKKNGTNITDSATKVILANNTAQTMTVNILTDAAANDYYELVWQSTNGNARLVSDAASGNIPLIPAVIATVTQVR